MAARYVMISAAGNRVTFVTRASEWADFLPIDPTYRSVIHRCAPDAKVPIAGTIACLSIDCQRNGVAKNTGIV
jgi:hypothetical protein